MKVYHFSLSLSETVSFHLPLPINPKSIIFVVHFTSSCYQLFSICNLLSFDRQVQPEGWYGKRVMRALQARLDHQEFLNSLSKVECSYEPGKVEEKAKVGPYKERARGL